MKKWITSIIEAASVDAVSKARKDVVEIAKSVGYEPTYIFRYLDGNESLEALHSRIDGITAAMHRGDLLVYQYPCYNSERFEKEFIHRMKLRGIHVVLLIHDTEILRGNKGEVEKAIFSEVDLLITHGEKMSEGLREYGVQTPMISKELFDYLNETEGLSKSEQVEKKVIMAGNLRKSVFLKEWPHMTPIEAYGRFGNLELDAAISYRGEFQQRELLQVITKDGIGLVWDSKIEGGGDYQRYTRYNAPHKLSLYLSLGNPIVVWDQSAAAEIVRKYNLGFAIASLDELDHVLAEVTDEELHQMKKNALRLSDALNEGFFTKKAFLDSEAFILFHGIETHESV
ncbi:sugar transferase [Enterococcus sp. LJL98]